MDAVNLLIAIAGAASFFFKLHCIETTISYLAMLLADDPCGGKNVSSSPHRLLGSAMLRWGSASGVRGSSGRVWLKLAKLLHACRSSEIVEMLQEPGSLDILGADVEAAVRAATRIFEGDPVGAAAGFAEATKLVASDEASKLRTPMLLYLHARAAFGAQQWAVAATAFGDAATTRRRLVASARGGKVTGKALEASAGPALPRVHKWESDAFARLGDGRQYLGALRRHVLSTGECSHWPEFCLTLPGTSVDGLSRVPLEVCAPGEEPPIDLLAEEERELTASAKAAATRASRAPPAEHPAAAAAASLAAARRDLTLASRELECSLGFVEEHLIDEVVLATASAGSESATPIDAGAMALPEVQLAYGQVYYPSMRRLLARSPLAETLRSASVDERKFVHLGSNIGTESFFVALTAGPSMRVEGYDLVCSLVRRAEALRERFAAHVPSVTFLCADALTASIGDVALLWLDNQAWDPHFMRVLYRKLQTELPDGALVVDFAALDAQFDYARDWSSDAPSEPLHKSTQGTLEVIGCATLDASWDRGGGTHVALLRQTSPQNARWSLASAASRITTAAPLALDGPLAEENDVARRDASHAVRLLWNWHCITYKPFGAAYAALAADERALVTIVLRELSASLDETDVPTNGVTADVAATRLPRVRFEHVVEATRGGGATARASLLFVGAPRVTLAVHEAAWAVGVRRHLSIDASLLARARSATAAAVDASGAVGDPTGVLAELTPAGALRGGVSIYGLGWGGDGELHLALRCDDMATLPARLRMDAAAQLVRVWPALSQHEAHAILGSQGAPAHGWLPVGVLIYTYDTRFAPCNGRRPAVDADVCEPIGIDLRLLLNSPAILDAAGLWVPDYASSASVVLPLAPTATSQRARLSAVVEFGVERGGMRYAPLAGEGTNGTQADPQAGSDHIVQPWWCVCRQIFASIDVGEAVVPLMDRYSDLSLLGFVRTAVAPLGVADLVDGGEASKSWRVAFSL